MLRAAAAPELPTTPLAAHQTPADQIGSEPNRCTGCDACNSPKDPWREAEILAGRLFLGESQTVVALGMGLGYHLLKLVHRLKPLHKLIIVEHEPEIWLAALGALDLTPLFERAHTWWVVEPDWRKALSQVRRQVSGNGQGLIFFAHPPSLRAHGAFYQEVIQGFKTFSPWRRAPLRRQQEKIRVLIVNPDYFLIPEAVSALGKLGHEVKTVLFDKRRDRGEEVMRGILGQVKDSVVYDRFPQGHQALS